MRKRLIFSVFQGLENSRPIFPRIGKFRTGFSKDWKKAAAAMLIAACTVFPAGAQTPLATNTLPRIASNGVARVSDVIAYFNTNLNGSTVTSNRFFLHSPMMGLNRGSIGFNAATNRATLNPARDFFPGDFVTAHLTRSITNAAGTVELRPHQWAFSAQAGRGSALLIEITNYGCGGAYDIQLGDLDNDGDLDAVVGVPGSMKVFTNQGGAFYNSGQSLGDGRRVALADFNRDGALDIFGSGWWFGHVWTNNGFARFDTNSAPLAGGDARVCSAGDVTGDGYPDVIVANDDYQSVVWTNDGTGRLGLNVSLFATNGTSAVFGDFNQDGHLDAICGGSSPQVFTNNGSRQLSYNGQSIGVGVTYRAAIAVGDVTGDGWVDLLIGASGQNGIIWTNNRSGWFANSGQSLAALNLTDADLADLDGDGDLDAVLSQTTYGPNVFLNDGTGHFTSTGQSFSNGGDCLAACGDVDGDGDMDVVTADLGGRLRVYRNELAILVLRGTNDVVLVNGAAASTASGTDFGGPHEPGMAFTNCFSVSNAGVATLTMNATTNGTGAGQFRLVGLSASVGAGNTGIFSIVYSPTVPGVATADVVVVNNGTNTPFVIRLRGEALYPVVTDIIPANAAPSANPTSRPLAQINQRLNSAQINTDTVQLYSDQLGYIDGTIIYQDDLRTVAFNPAYPFKPGERVTMELTRGIGNAWATAELPARAWSFDAQAKGSGALQAGGQTIGTNRPADIAFADVDGDRDLDAFLVQPGKPDEVWINDGTGSFSDSGQRLGTNAGLRVAFADIDRDGDLDACVTHSNQNAILWLNDGDGVFADSGQALPAGIGRDVLFADFTADGWLDIYFVCQGAVGRIWTNNRAGVFSQRQDTPSMQAFGAEAADLNGNGFMDLFVACNGGGSRVYTNNGANALYDSGQVLGGAASWDVGLGDFNGDGHYDAFLANNGGGNTVWTNNGHAAFFNSGQLLGTNASRAVTPGDFDGDGDLDALVCHYGQPNRIWTNNGRGVFGPAATLFGGGLSLRASAGDVDGDGALDVLVAKSGAPGELWLNAVPQLYVLGTNGKKMTNGAPPSAISGTDFGNVTLGSGLTRTFTVTNAGDGWLTFQGATTNGTEAACFVVTAFPSSVVSHATAGFSVRFTPATGKVHTASISLINNSTNSPFVMNLRGWDAPGRVIATSPVRCSNSVPSNANVTATFSTNLATTSVTTNRFLLWSHSRGLLAGSLAVNPGGWNATLDPAATFLAGEKLTAQFTWGIRTPLGSALQPYLWSFTAAAATSRCVYAKSQTMTNAGNAVCGDFNGDGRLDLALDNGTIWTNDRTGVLANSGQATGGSGDVKLGDINRDGRLDIVYENIVCTNDGTGRFSQSQSLGVGNTRCVDVGDLNGDGWPDVVVGSYTGARIFTNNGAGVVAYNGQQLTADWVYDVAIGDMNGDGLPDIVTLFSSSIVFTNNGALGFNQSASTDQGTLRNALQLADMNNDGRLDILEGRCASDSGCRILIDNGSGGYSSWTTFNFGGFGNQMAAGDVNGDGFMDVAVASDRSSSRLYLGNGAGGFMQVSHPFLGGSDGDILFADIDNNRQMDILTARGGLGGEVWLNSFTDFQFLGTNRQVIASGEAASAAKGSLFLETAPQGLTAATHVFMISNSAPAPAIISSKTIGGAQAASFSFGNTPTVIEGGTVSNFVVVCAPVAVGVNAATVSIVNTSLNSPYLIPLACEGTAPVVVHVEPDNGMDAAARSTNLTARFSWPVRAASVTSNRFFAWSESHGPYRGTIALNAASNTAALVPDRYFRGGERVFAEVAAGVENAEGTATVQYRAWSFHAAAAGSGIFIPSGQSLATNDVRCAAAGDLDGDGDVDMLLATAGSQADRVWTNHAGRFYDSGQLLGTNNGRVALLGDLDGDNTLDAFIVNWSQPAQVWTNNGKGVFQSNGQFLAGSNARAATMGDIDGDGDLDVILIRQDTTGSVWTNNGRGQLANSGRTVPAGCSVDIADVNGDGFLDLAICTTNGSVAGQICTNDGGGQFTFHAAFGPAPSQDVALGDLNGDHAIDLYLAVEGGADQVWTNNGAGAFFNTGQSLGTNATYGVALGDANGDGALDAFTVNYNQRSILWTNHGAGLFSDSGQSPGTGTFWNATLVDVDGDNDLDAYLPCATGRDQLWLNRSANLQALGTNRQPVLSGESPSTAKGTDFGKVWMNTRITNIFRLTNSGQSALSISGVTTGGAAPAKFVVASWPSTIGAGAVSNLPVIFDPATSFGAFTATVTIANTSGENPYNLNVGGYGLPFCVTNAIPTNGGLRIATNATLTAQFNTELNTATVNSNRFVTHSGHYGFRKGAVSASPTTRLTLTPTIRFRPGEEVFATVTVGLTNAAGTLAALPKSWSFFTRVSGGPATFGLHQSLSNTANAADVALGDFDHDGDLDAWIAKDGMADEVWTNRNGVFYNSGQNLGADSARGVELADVDDDGDLDALVANYSGMVYVWTNNGRAVFQQGPGFSTASGYTMGVHAADVDGNGSQDFIASQLFYWAAVYKNNGAGSFSGSEYIGNTMYATRDISFGDLDGDGDLDLYINDINNYPDCVWKNNGSGGFAKFSAVDNQNATANAIGDLDGDGDLDAFVTRSSGGNRVRFNDGSGVFTDSDQLLGSANSVDVALNDFDGDGDLDAFVVNSGSGNTIWINDGNGVFAGNGQSLGAGDNVAVALGDLDHDGDVDALVVKNGQEHEVWLNSSIVKLTGVAGPNGVLVPTGVVDMATGGSCRFVATASPYCLIETFRTNGGAVAAAVSNQVYTNWWLNVSAPGTASVTFAALLAPQGTPLYWMAGYGLTNEGQSFAEAEAFDGDADLFNAHEEWIADTDPTDWLDFFQVSAVAARTNCVLYFDSSAIRNYTLERNDAFHTGAWLAVAGQSNVPGSGALMSLADSNAPVRRTHRLSVRMP